jgi:hypothetical protein
MERFLPTDKLLKFTASKKKYFFRWDHTFLDKKKANLIITYSYNESELPEELILTLTYLDSTKRIELNENPESNIVKTIKIPKPKSTGKSEIPISIDIAQGTKKLWKVSFEVITDKKVSYLYYGFGIAPK